MHTPTQHVEVLFVVVTSACCILAAAKFIRLHDDPLRSYPGPRLASLTTWYKAYHDLIKDGGLVELLYRLHDKYGSVVRISPNELHFSDPQAFANIYAAGSKFYKEPTLYAALGQDESSVGFIDYEQAKARRDVLSPLFSRRAILRLENVVQDKVDKLLIRLLASDLNKPVNMSRAFRSMAVDIITSYCFAQCPDALDHPEFDHPLLLSIESATLMNWIFKWFPLLMVMLLRAPSWLTLRLSPESKGFLELRKRIAAQIDDILKNPDSLESAEHEIIYHHLLSPQRNHPVPSRKSLEDEALNLTFAGSDTVGNTSALGTFHVLNNKTILAKLTQELINAWPDKESPMGYEALEKLPYLTAVIKESLRMSHGVVTPLPRVVAPNDAVIAGNHVPAGTIVSIGATFIHWNANIFPDPHKFSPERWLHRRSSETFLVPFSRGPRTCLGVNLAWCELYLIFANVFRKTDLELYHTTAEDFKFRAYFLPHYKGRHLRARVRERSV